MAVGKWLCDKKMVHPDLAYFSPRGEEEWDDSPLPLGG
jgi:hypothetical protein